MMIRTAAAAAALACLMSTAARAENREPVSVRVSYAGLDLASAEGRRLLDARIDRAVRGACRSVVFGLRGVADTRRCTEEMRRDALVRVARIQPAAPVAVASTR